MRVLAGAAAACALAVLPAVASADIFSALTYGVHASTVGDGVTLEKPLLYDFGLRLITGTLSISQQTSYDANRYTATTKYNDFGLIADYRPSAGRYRISAGLVFGNDRVLSVAREDGGLLRVGNGIYTTAQAGRVTTHLRFERPSIYAGVGTGAGLIRGFAVEFDGGMLLRNGTPSAEATGTSAGTPGMKSDLDHLRGELRTHVVVPVLSAGLTYRP
ncbi:MAG: hypothetical protein JOZ24_09000 [Candidatus Eremiobacteraeota bacterium]|nr:hypothetical protein [Candidatus Eremiobacteraeota bacterium]